MAEETVASLQAKLAELDMRVAELEKHKEYAEARFANEDEQARYAHLFEVCRPR